MQSKLIGGWLLSTSFGVLGLISLGGYTRLKRAGLSMVEWKPLNVEYPKNEFDWEKEYQRYKEFPEFKQSRIPLDEFKEIYLIEYSHRLYARIMGGYLVIPMLIFWQKKLIPSTLKPRLLAITAMFGVQGLLGWIMVKSGLEKKEYQGRVKVAPINLAIHLFCGVGLYSYILSTGLSCWRKAPEKVFTTLEKFNAGKILRRRYMGLLHLTFLTIFSGALVAGSDAGKTLGNWPFYGNNYFFPDDAFNREPLYTNFIENTSLIQFVHRNLGYLTFASAIELWFKMKSLKTILPYMANAHLLLTLSTFQVILGITALMRGTPLYESFSHQLNGMLFLSTVIYGLSSFRKPNKAFISKLLGKS